MRLYDLDIIWDTPYITTADLLTRSCIADEKNLKKFVALNEKMGQLKKVIYKRSHFKETNLLSQLTKKQRQILEIAKSEGYYKIPRRINGDGLAKILKCSKATVLEHLRRIENKVMCGLE